MTETSTPSAEVAAFRTVADEIERQVGLSIVGQHEAIRGVLISLILGAHALLEGVPGLGKTSWCRPSQARSISHSRIQFTPDLMPADITGTPSSSTIPRTPPRSCSSAGRSSAA